MTNLLEKKMIVQGNLQHLTPCITTRSGLKGPKPKKMTGSRTGAIFFRNDLTNPHKKFQNRATREF